MSDNRGPQGEQGIQGEPGTPYSVNRVLNWLVTHEPFITIIVFVILAVMSFSTAVLARQTQDAVKNTDLIAQCTTPGSRCYQLTQQAALQRVKELKAADFCLLEILPNVFPIKDVNQLRTDYNNCVVTESAK